jgi:8-oxo-dGTP diphosphatase
MRKEVVCALIVADGKLLVTQHGENSGHPWKWEFPGGKIQPGESHEEALTREIMEELDIGITVIAPLEPVLHTYPGREILLYPYLCRWEEGQLLLKEHHDGRWIDPEETADLDMLEADFKMLGHPENWARLLAFSRQ